MSSPQDKKLEPDNVKEEMGQDVQSLSKPKPRVKSLLLERNVKRTRDGKNSGKRKTVEKVKTYKKKETLGEQGEQSKQTDDNKDISPEQNTILDQDGIAHNHPSVPVKYVLNYKFEIPDQRDHLFKAVIGPRIDPKTLPSSVDLRPNWGSIFDQGELGSCVANSIGYCIRYCLMKEKREIITPSRLFIYYNGRSISGLPIDQDTGLYVRDGFKSVAKFKCCDEKYWSYNPTNFKIKPPEEAYTISNKYTSFEYLSVTPELDYLKKCLADGYPISFGAFLYSSFFSLKVEKTGIVPIPNVKKERSMGGHCMTIAGYDNSKKAFLVCNSWDDDWALKGFCYMPFNYITNKNLCSDFWTARALI